MKAWHNRVPTRRARLGACLAVVLLACATACDPNAQTPIVGTPTVAPSGTVKASGSPTPTPTPPPIVGDPSPTPSPGASPTPTPRPSSPILQDPSPSPTVTIDPAMPTGMTINPASGEVWGPALSSEGVAQGMPQTFKFDGYVILGNGATTSVTWTSMDTSRLNISSTGLVTAVAVVATESSVVVKIRGNYNTVNYGEYFTEKSVTIHYEGDIAVTVN